jgi:tetratricopeptide (TPR) repeat protein
MKAHPIFAIFLFTVAPILSIFAYPNSSISATKTDSICSIDCQKISDTDSAIAEIQSEKNQNLTVTTLDAQSAINYNNQGVAKFKSGDNYGAIADYNRAISINPKYAESYVNRGIAKFKLGDIKAAISDYDRAIAINMRDGEAYYNRGIAQFELGDDRAAILDFDRAIAIHPQDAEIYGNRGVAKSAVGDKPGAIVDLTQAAKLFRAQGQLDDAEKMMKIVRQLNQI